MAKKKEPTMAELMQEYRAIGSKIEKLTKEAAHQPGKLAEKLLPGKKKRPSARRPTPLPPLARWAPVDDEEDNVCGYKETDGEKIASQTIKLVGKDELIISWDPDRECARYFIMQPTSKDPVYVVSELKYGEMLGHVSMTPSGEPNSEDAIDMVEGYLAGDADDEDEE